MSLMSPIRTAPCIILAMASGTVLVPTTLVTMTTVILGANAAEVTVDSAGDVSVGEEGSKPVSASGQPVSLSESGLLLEATLTDIENKINLLEKNVKKFKFNAETGSPESGTPEPGNPQESSGSQESGNPSSQPSPSSKPPSSSSLSGQQPPLDSLDPSLAASIWKTSKVLDSAHLRSKKLEREFVEKSTNMVRHMVQFGDNVPYETFYPRKTVLFQFDVPYFVQEFCQFPLWTTLEMQNSIPGAFLLTPVLYRYVKETAHEYDM
jgi:hypothetical protein